MVTLKVLNFWKFTCYCSLKPLWSGIGEVVPACTSPTLHPPSPIPPNCASIVATSTVRVNVKMSSVTGLHNLDQAWTFRQDKNPGFQITRKAFILKDLSYKRLFPECYSQRLHFQRFQCSMCFSVCVVSVWTLWLCFDHLIEDIPVDEGVTIRRDPPYQHVTERHNGNTIIHKKQKRYSLLNLSSRQPVLRDHFCRPLKAHFSL